MRTSTSKSSAQRRTRAQVGAGAQRQPRRGEALADVLMTLYHWAARRVGRFILSLFEVLRGRESAENRAEKKN